MKSNDVFELLDGNWEGTEDIAHTPWMPGGVSRATIRNDVRWNGTALIHDYQSERDGKPWFSAHGVMTAGPGPDAFRLSWFDSFGFFAEHPADGSLDGDRLVFTRKSDRGVTRHTYVLTGRYEFQLLLQSSFQADEMKTIATGLYHRVR